MEGHPVLSNLIRISSSFLVLVLFSVAGFAQETQKPEKTKQTAATGIVATTRPSAEYDPSAWKEYKSDAGRFSILFPGVPQEETRQAKSERGEVEAHVFKLQELATYAVMYFDNFVARDMNPEPTRKMLAASVQRVIEMSGAAPLRQSEITLDGNPGLFFTLRLPDSSIMRLKIYAAGFRIYQVMITTPPEQDATDDQRRFYEATADKFLNSFTLAPVPPAVIAGGRGVSGRTPQNSPRVPVSGSVVNGKVISKPSPRYPADARAAGVSGVVEVAVTIDEEGRVLKAVAVSGPVELREAAVEAARKARFSPTRLSGQPVKVSGRLSYNFSLR
jgi:TonB family protein